MKMKKLILLPVIIPLLLFCERSTDNFSSYFTTRIADFNLDCQTCILEFPEDQLKAEEELGESPNNYYQAVNLSMGNYEIGQMLKVRIRKPDADEIGPCVATNPSGNNKDVFIMDTKNYDRLILNYPVYLSCHECLNDPQNKLNLCFESVLNDSRCPTGVLCFWEGNAQARFKFEKYNEMAVLFNLNTHKGFITDTIVYGYKITLLGLKPYPVIDHKIDQSDYIAKLLIEKE